MSPRILKSQNHCQPGEVYISYLSWQVHTKIWIINSYLNWTFDLSEKKLSHWYHITAKVEAMNNIIICFKYIYIDSQKSNPVKVLSS